MPRPAGHWAASPVLKLIAAYAYRERKNVANRFRIGEGLVGQCALEKQSILLTNVPGDYIQISSGLGEGTPQQILVLPVLFEGMIMGVIELASFQQFSQIHRTFLDQLMESIGVVLNMISANMRTEELLQQSQSLTQELQSQSRELQQQQDQLKTTNTELEAQANELEEKAALLAQQNNKVEQKNREVELARAALEEKAEQLALSSKYKSEFLANMSHELRTPLNSMLILAKLLADNTDNRLSPKQVEFASTIQASGADLLNLINEILDLSKVEAGKMEIEITDASVGEIQEYVERSFDHVAQQKGLSFAVRVEPGTPQRISTDTGRLQQVLRNLLSNAFKFTESGEVNLTIGPSDRSVVLDDGRMVPSGDLIAFAVTDSGIGIAKDKLNLIFEAFQQADGTTSRRYGGTGLGLSISREITRLLGGRITVDSDPGHGSTFTLYLPANYVGAAASYDSPGGGAGDDLFGGNSGSGGRGNNNGGGGNGSGGNGRALPDTPRPAPASSRSTAATSNTATLSRPLPPRETATSEPAPASRPAPAKAEAATITDDRDNINPDDRVLLVIEDDVNFARILLDRARAENFKVLVALNGRDGLEMARTFGPDAVSLDLRLPDTDLDGWTILDRLKRDPQTRHIPVQVVSVLDRDEGVASLGAVSYLEKPVTSDALHGAFAHLRRFVDRAVKHLLVVEDDEAQRISLVELLGNEGVLDGQASDVSVTAVATGEEALEALEGGEFDCVVLDLTLPGLSGVDVLTRIKADPRSKDLPVIIYTGKNLSKKEESQLKRHASAVITKDVGSADRLLDDTALFLHRVIDRMPEAKRRIVEQRSGFGPDTKPAPAETAPPAKSRRKKAADTPPAPVADLSGHTVLVVDDDMRNIFALTSMLEAHGLTVLFAENGRDGIETLEAHGEIAVVLMDVMMPEMDGYETMERIRAAANPAWHDLPIIALTAKAMAGDREKCLEAGATDYIPKPVDVDKLLAMLGQYLAA